MSAPQQQAPASPADELAQFMSTYQFTAAEAGQDQALATITGLLGALDKTALVELLSAAIRRLSLVAADSTTPEEHP